MTGAPKSPRLRYPNAIQINQLAEGLKELATAAANGKRIPPARLVYIAARLALRAVEVERIEWANDIYQGAIREEDRIAKSRDMRRLIDPLAALTVPGAPLVDPALQHEEDPYK
jgi:hypothetical protein